MGEWMFWVLGIAAAIGVAAFRYVRAQRRRREMQAFASNAGLRYSSGDPFGTVRLGFRLFRQGDGRGVDNVCWGEAGGLEVRLFDYWYHQESRNSDGHTDRTYRYFSCALVRIPGIHGPRLTVEPEGVLSRPPACGTSWPWRAGSATACRPWSPSCSRRPTTRGTAT